ncbi:MAG: TetR/AcrR family transcriptional regulator [Anaerolineae bacterium]|nr:TetR/AcrR family transcriptional regulator [Anaerolineae bacterium]
MTKHKRGDERREQILEAANTLFRSQGYAATSMRQIAAEAGFGRAVSGLYNHFPNKEAIFAELLISRSPYEDLMIALAEVEGDTLAAFLHNWFDALWPILEAHLDFLQLVMIDLQEFEGRTLGTFLNGFLPSYYDLFSRIQQMQGMRTDLPLPVLIRTIASVMIGYLFTEVVARNALGNEPFPMALGDSWIDGLVSILARGMTDPSLPQV